MILRWTVAAAFLACGCGGPATPNAGPISSTVEYSSGKDTVRGHLARPSGAGPLPGIIVVHDDFGLTAWAKQQAGRLAEKGYAALAVDLYRGQVVSDLMDAHIMDRGLPEERVLADLKAAVDYLTGRPDVRPDAVGAIGWDSGGGYALDAAIKDKRLRTAVICYGRLTTDPALLGSMEASVLGIFAGQDEGISAETIEQFRLAMQKAGKRLAGVHIYPPCRHGFMNQDLDAEMTADAWRKIDSHLDAELKR
jgi:carboxymethylenebutenolidase